MPATAGPHPMKQRIRDKLDNLADRLQELDRLLATSEAASDMDNYRKLTREHAEITPVVGLYREYCQAQEDEATARELLADPEMKELAAAELESALSDEIIPAKQEIVVEATAGEFSDVYQRAHGLLDSRLCALREQLDGFRRQVQESFGQEARERHTLAHEIRNLQQLNAQMAQEALNLTKALKGDNKTQGNWGEVVLTRVLEASGLREGYEYQTQVSIETDNRSRMQPDVIVRLPQGKDVVIDAKMTLVAYERYFNAEDDYTRESALQEHIASVRNHIRLLGRKDYQQLPGLRTLDYVLMFIPVEPAFLLALDRQPELITEALKNNIMLVSPTTLLVALRTIANLWRYEHQSRNAQQIADRASKLYDKMRLFIDDMSAIGQSLDKAQDNYRQAMKKLSSGRGNVLAQAEAFRGLGVEIKREINPDLAEQAVSQDEEYRLRSVPEQPNDEAYQRDDEYNQQSR